jgi:chitinase
MKHAVRLLARAAFFFALSIRLLWAQSPTPLAANGRLQVINRQLCNEAGSPIQLRGMSSHGLQWFDNCYTQASVQSLATDWGIDVFRAAMYVESGGYLSDPPRFRAKINQLVDWTAAAGIYCIIDWHILENGNPNARLTEAKDFFRTMAQTHAGKKHVIYELCNEPNGVDWATIKSYAEAVIPEIRQYDPTAIILVGTPQWSGLPGDVRANPLTGSFATNVMYTFHFYAGSHYTQDYIKDVLQTVPLFISEWGTSNYTGNGGNDYNNAQAWVDLMGGNNPAGIKVSWCNWSFADKDESSAALQPGSCGSGSWNNTSPSGTWVKQRILSPADSWAGTAPRTFTPLPARTIVGYWQNWNDGNFMNLRDVPAKYSVVNVSFLETSNGDGFTPTFTPTAPYTEASFKADVQALQQRGTPVVISIGGQNGVVKLTTTAQKNTFVQGVKQIIDRYGFDGIDLDLEGSSMTYGGNNPDFRNPTQPATLNLIAAVRELKSAYGAGFIVSAAPETYYVQTGYNTYGGTAGAFLPVLYNIRDILNSLHVQLYNTGSMLALNGQVYTSATADFIVSMTDMLLRGFPVAGTGQNFPALRPDQVAIGLPACPSAAGSGYTAPAEVLKALDYLTKGISYGGTYATTATYPGLRGMMTWSVNWDKAGCGRPSYEFVNTYYNYFFGTPGTPSVTLTSPASGASFTAPATINLAASVANASPTKVEFYQGTTKLGEDATAPYEFSWANVPAGSYSLTAKAVLSSGNPLTSAAVNVTVNGPANQPPTVSLTAPANGATFTAPATVNLAASASDTDGTVSKVEFFSGSTKLGEDATAPYEFAWTNVSAGTYSLTARATDNAGASTTSAAVSITVNGTPPSGNGDILGPDCVAKATTVEFEINAANRNNVSSYSAWWSNGASVSISNPAGQPWKATVTFGSGYAGGDLCVGVNYSVAPWYKQFCKSVPVCTGPPPPANQPPTVSLTSPANGATFTAPASINLSASAADADGTVSKVEFFQGSTKLGEDATAPYEFAWTNVAAGSYSLTAKATDNAGASTTSAAVSITVNGTPPPPAGDITGPDCAAVNAVLTYELSAANRANATSYSWWCTGSTQSVTPVAGQPFKATINFGPWFSGGDVCVGVNYSAAPWYKQFCKTVSKCVSRLSAEGWNEVPENAVFPNPTDGAFTFEADRPVRALRLFDVLGRSHFQHGALAPGQRLTFGERLDAGSYLLRIDYADQTGRTVKVVKVGR